MENNIIFCKDCKYAVRTDEGEYNPDDIVCSYWMSDGLTERDYCSRAEEGVYKKDPLDITFAN